MAWRHTAPWVGLLLVATLVLAPGAAAEAHQGTTSTGDVDTYGAWTTTHDPYCATLTVLVFYEVEIELHDTTPGDRVLLGAQHHLVPPAGAAVATHEDPSASVNVTGGACDPAVEVAGLTVSGDLGYTVSW